MCLSNKESRDVKSSQGAWNVCPSTCPRPRRLHRYWFDQARGTRAQLSAFFFYQPPSSGIRYTACCCLWIPPPMAAMCIESSRRGHVSNSVAMSTKLCWIVFVSHVALTLVSFVFCCSRISTARVPSNSYEMLLVLCQPQVVLEIFVET